MHLFPYFTYKTVMKFIKDINLIGIQKLLYLLLIRDNI